MGAMQLVWNQKNGKILRWDKSVTTRFLELRLDNPTELDRIEPMESKRFIVKTPQDYLAWEKEVESKVTETDPIGRAIEKQRARLYSAGEQMRLAKAANDVGQYHNWKRIQAQNENFGD